MKAVASLHPYYSRCACFVIALIAATSCSRATVLPPETRRVPETSPTRSVITASMEGPTPSIGASEPMPTSEPGSLSQHPIASRTSSIEPSPEQPLSRTATPDMDETLHDQSLHSGLTKPSPTAERRPTVTPHSTLTADKEGELLSTLLLTNASCELPCWWGIQPGVTTEQQARELVEAYGLEWIVSNTDFRAFGLGYPIAGADYRFTDVGVSLWIDDGIVKLIEVSAIRRRDDSEVTFVRDWQAYSPAAIVGRYGRPELVEFEAVENSSYYRLLLAYDSLGIELAYIMPFTVTDDGGRQICLGLDTIDYIYPSLYPAHQSSSLPVKLLVSRLTTYVSWEETTGQSLDDFVTIALNSDCVQVAP